MPIRFQPGRSRFARWPGLAIQALTMLRADARRPVPQARFSPKAGPRAPWRAIRSAKEPCSKTFGAEQRGRVSARRLDQMRVDLERAQVVRGADVVHGGDQGLLDLALGRGGVARWCERQGEKRQSHATGDTNMLGELYQGGGCGVVERGFGSLDRA